jgi:hypothetical protein
MMILASGGDLTGDTLDMNFVMTRGVKTLEVRNHVKMEHAMVLLKSSQKIK